MSRSKTSQTEARILRDAAVRAVMARGALERSGGARLAVLRDTKITICYRTPFNPLPIPSEEQRFRLALAGRTVERKAYGIDIRLEGSGKVFDVEWDLRGELRVALFKTGTWQGEIAKLARENGGAPARSAARQRGTDRLVDSLERENRQLRNTIANMMLDKLLPSDAAEGGS